MSFTEIGDRFGRKVTEEGEIGMPERRQEESGDEFVQLHCCRVLGLEPKKRTCSRQVIRAYIFFFIRLGLVDKNKLRT